MYFYLINKIYIFSVLAYLINDFITFRLAQDLVGTK